MRLLVSISQDEASEASSLPTEWLFKISRIVIVPNQNDSKGILEKHENWNFQTRSV